MFLIKMAANTVSHCCGSSWSSTKLIYRNIKCFFFRSPITHYQVVWKILSRRYFCRRRKSLCAILRQCVWGKIWQYVSYWFLALSKNEWLLLGESYLCKVGFSAAAVIGKTREGKTKVQMSPIMNRKENCIRNKYYEELLIIV